VDRRGAARERDGRIALYLTDAARTLWRPGAVAPALTPREARVVDALRVRGASFFTAVHEACGGGFAGDTVSALWNLVWKGLVTNDTFTALRAFTAPPEKRDRRTARRQAAFRSRRTTPPAAEGRWTLVSARAGEPPSATEWSASIAQQLLARYGVVSRETVAAESVPGGFSAVYDVFKALEDAGRIRRGYFAADVGAAQFALPTALDTLRTLREDRPVPKWSGSRRLIPRIRTARSSSGHRATARGAVPHARLGATVILVNGAAAAWIARGGRQLTVFLPEDEPRRSLVAREIATSPRGAQRRLARVGDQRAIRGGASARGVPRRSRLLGVRDGVQRPAGAHELVLAI
jgi:ATP-dependent Lhr-like helicase